MSSPPPYNLPSPPSLFVPGLLSGAPVSVDVSSIRPLTGDIFVASLLPGSDAAAIVRSREGEEGKVAVKVVSVDGTRAPRDVRREARVMGKLTGHPNVRFLPFLYFPASAHSALRNAQIIALLNTYLSPDPFSPRLSSSSSSPFSSSSSGPSTPGGPADGVLPPLLNLSSSDVVEEGGAEGVRAPSGVKNSANVAPSAQRSSAGGE